MMQSPRKLDLILPLGDARLYQVCAPVTAEEVPGLLATVQDLHEILLEFRAIYNAGRAVAAPQIGVMKRLVYLHLGQPQPLFNPVLTDLSDEKFELWDDCLCFPQLLVRVRRHVRCTLTYRDANWQEHVWSLEGSLAELLQHECDHLDGILATQRAIDDRSFKWRVGTAPIDRE
jgi:peptide deformylase